MSALSKFDRYKAGAIHRVAVEAWGGEEVCLREMDAERMSEFLKLNKGEDDFSIPNACAVVALHLCDEEGHPIPADERAEAAAELQGHKFEVVTLLFTESLKASGLATEEIEDAAGN